MKKLLPEVVVLCAILMAVGYGFAQTWTIIYPPMGVLPTGGTVMSADGKIILSVGSEASISTNFGANWTPIAGFSDYYFLASSADETKLVRANRYYRVFYYSIVSISTNSGVSWNSTPAPNTNWSALTSSADGSKLYAAVSGGLIYCSTNLGKSWQTYGWPSKSWTSIATSADGTKVVAAANDFIYGSTNSGLTCVQLSAPSNSWSSICSSADGAFLAATGNSCYTSTNSGASWTLSGQGFHLLACSADGSKLIASTGTGGTVGTSGYIYLSTDYGNTWVSNTPASLWSFVSCSADGNEFVAATGGGGQTSFWILKNTPSPQLNLTSSNTGLLLSWLIPSTNFVVQQSPDLISWSSIMDAPALNLTNLNNELTLSPTNSSGFFRLISQ